MRCSMISTGLLSLMAESMSPLASKQVAGMMSLRPGTWLNRPCRAWECWAAEPQPRPTQAQNTSGTQEAPPNM